jgi:ABC-type transport system involved in cytochrome c biogenesis permease subunit
LFGFENITNNNGWAMAAVGASIVFSGLVVLSFVISQIHKILALWDEREKHIARFRKLLRNHAAEKFTPPAYEQRQFPTADELAGDYAPLVDGLEKPFALSQLFEVAKQKDLPHPHLSIQRLQEAGILITEGDGTFKWNR